MSRLEAMRVGWGRASVAAALWIVAAMYFLLGSTMTLEWLDEGQFLYLSWRVSEGALPYRDFHHNYAPSVFFVNGGLFRLFGPEVLPIRIALVLLKATAVVLVYLLGRRLAGVAAGVVAWVLAVAVWGLPLWFVNAPYASLYQNVLCLAGIAVYLRLRPRPVLAGLLSGLAFGLATTFKQTGGILCWLGFLAALLVCDEAGGRGVPRGRWAWRALAPAFVTGGLGLFVWYSVRFGGPRDMMLLAGPAVIGMLWTAGRLRARPLPVRDAAWPWAVVGFALPPLAILALYLALGALPALLDDTLFGHPQMLQWVVPFPPFHARAAAALAVSGGAVAAAALVLRLERGRLAGVPALVVLGLAAATIPRATLADAYALLTWLLPLAAWAAAIRLLLSRPAARDEAFLVVAFVTWSALLVLQPVADAPHLLQAAPMFLPMAALGVPALSRLYRRLGGDVVGRRVGAVAVLVLVVMVTAPLVRALATARSTERPIEFARARHVRVTGDKPRNAAALLAHLEKPENAARGLVALPHEPMLYYLAGRRSALEEPEFAIYLGSTGLIPAADARELVDEPRVVATLDAERPLIVAVGGERRWRAFETAFPTLAAAIRTRYREQARFGDYRVLAYADDDARRE